MYDGRVGNDYVVEFVLGNSVDSVSVYRLSAHIRCILGGRRTDSNHERADCETGDGILQQIRRTSTQQRRRGAHASIVICRLERFTDTVSMLMRLNVDPTYYPIVALVDLVVFAGRVDASPRW